MTTSRERFIEFWTEEEGRPPEMRWEICSHCHGEGTSTRYLGAYTQSDRDEMGEDWDDFIDNWRRGVYDQPCPECGGSGKVREFTGDAEQGWALWWREEADDMAVRRAESGYAW